MEIGSEFQSESYAEGKNEFICISNYSKRYVLSGRTALFLIAQELKNKGIFSIALPEYCCASMVKPFLELNFDIEFNDSNNVPDSKAILVMDYFGFIKHETYNYVKKCKNKNKIIIVDATQTAFSKNRIYEISDYILISYRKWFDCLCAVVYSKSGFTIDEYTKENREYLKIWREAAKKKKEYLKGNLKEKKDYLELYNIANKLLELDYKEYKASKEEIDIFEKIDSKYIINKRKENARILINALKGKGLLMYNEINENDCPLHVPILVEYDEKNRLRKKLNENEIFCPCHWPMEENIPHKNTRYHEQELSLICDQRYDKKDMKKIIKIFEKIYNKEEK